jgi:tripartite-type tricarboxylate transporter receptor subunit TctC
MPLFARRSFVIGAALAPLAPALAHAQASGTQASGTQAWPTRPVTLIIPFPAGGAMDLLGRSVAQDLTDLVGGQLDFACTLTTSPGPHIQAGRLRALAVTSATRTQQLPDVPTVEQAGFPASKPPPGLRWPHPPGRRRTLLRRSIPPRTPSFAVRRARRN